MANPTPHTSNKPSTPVAVKAVATDGKATGVAARAKTRTKKGEGPFSIFFVDREGHEHNRVTDKVALVGVLDRKTSKKELFDPAKYAEATKVQMLSLGLHKRLHVALINGVKSGKSAIEIAKGVHDNLVEGKIYTRTEGARVGRVFDAEPYIVAMIKLRDRQHSTKAIGARTGKPIMPMTKNEQTSMRTKLTSFASSKDRNAYLAILKTSSWYCKYLAEAQAAQKKTSDDNKEMAAEFDLY